MTEEVSPSELGWKVHEVAKAPEDIIQLPEIKIGGKTGKELKEMLISGGFKVSEPAKYLLESEDFPTLADEQELNLVKVKGTALGLTGYPNVEQVFKKAEEKGYGLCPAEAGPYLRIAYKEDQLAQPIYVAMEGLTGIDNKPEIFRFSQDWPEGPWIDEETLDDPEPKLGPHAEKVPDFWLDSTLGDSDRHLRADNHFVFVSKEVNLTENAEQTTTTT